jgi:glutaminyl-peptide cyclotransferase
MMRRRENCRFGKGQQSRVEDGNIHFLEKKAMFRSIRFLCALAALLGLACAEPAPPPPPPAPDPSLFSGERAWEHLERLVEIGPRVSGTSGAEEARSYIRAQLEAIGLEPNPHSFQLNVGLADGEVEKVGLESLVAAMPGESDDLVILAAPFDSRHFESFTHVGANNGASGAALLLEMARVLSVDPIPYTVWLAFLDGEAGHAEDASSEQVFLGSRALVHEMQETGALPRMRLMVYFNQVADRDLVIARDLRSDRVVRKLFLRAAKELGYESAFPPDRPFSRPLGGHVEFLSVGFRRVMAVIDDRFGGDEAPGVYWRTEEDTLERCDPESLAIVGAVSKAGLEDAVALLRRVDRFSRRPVPAPPPEPVEAVETPEPPGTSQEQVVPTP